ncbi:filamentous hemagglutinin N-terminal domain-containing protein [Pantanalinema sp. GBBB05]|uniref:two-partner secretion domain-containing protein n=1 Tax=Pantanalinema sp. GBBB05 TaxID=2604139 RepID=UPI003D81A17C
MNRCHLGGEVSCPQAIIQPLISGGWWLGSLCMSLAVHAPAPAQIIPDTTLPANSRVIPGCIRCVIEGGTTRGTYLFHSFREFSIPTGGEAWFNHGVTVQTILARVTGTAISHLDGLLKTNGTANLFLLNPNGIVFGANARLEIAGSFVASTAQRLIFPDGSDFSAITPQAPPLLTMSITPGLQYGTSFPGATIVNQGNLQAGQNLSLISDRLDLRGQLQAGSNLTLQAQDRVQIRDSTTMPFLAQAGANLLIQGDRSVDIFALHHPSSQLSSGGDLMLRSANPVLGDAHFGSGGSFRTEQPDGSLGTLYSPHDPVIRSLGNVSINAYEGASLHILAGGSVEIPNGIVITNADPVNGLVETVTLSNGSSQLIDGRTVPTVDIRAGVNPGTIGSPALSGTGIFSPPTLTTATPTSANIRVGNIVNRGGTVFLTNRYQPNGSLAGEIVAGAIDTRRVTGDIGNSGAVTLDSRSDIRFSTTSFAINTSAEAGSSGAIQLIADRNLILDGATHRIFGVSHSTTPGGEIQLIARNVVVRNGGILGTATFGSGDAGNITIAAIDAVTLDGVGTDESSSSVLSQVGNTGTGNSGTITIRARTVSLTNGAYVSTDTRGRGNAGDVTIAATDAAILDGEDASQFTSQVTSEVKPGAIGNTGNVLIRTARLSVTNGARLSTGVLSNDQLKSRGNAGNVIIDATDAVSFAGSASNGAPSAGGSQVDPGVIGNSGNLTIRTRTLSVTNGAVLSASTLGNGSAGNVTIQATDKVSLDGVGRNGLPSAVGSQVGPGASGDSGDVTITAETLSVTNGALLSTNSLSTGNAGNVTLRVTAAILVDGTGSNGVPSAVVSQIVPGAIGEGGNIDIQAGTLSVTNGALVSTSTAGQGNAGNVSIHATDTVALNGVGQTGLSSSIVSQVAAGAIGNGGNVTIATDHLLVTHGAGLDTSTMGTGDAGNITIDASKSVVFDGVGRNGFLSGAGSKVGAGATGDGGNLSITTRRLSVTNGAQLSVGTLGTGDAGNISIHATDAIDLDGVAQTGPSSGIGSQVGAGATGNGGHLTIATRRLSATNGAQLDVSTLGTGNAGNITIQAIELVNFDGVGRNGRASGAGSQVAPGATGAGGNIAIHTRSLSLANQAVLTASSLGDGPAGDVEVQAQSLQLEDGAAIAAITAAGSGGNITLTLGDWLLLRRGSLISTTAGTAAAGGDGGNITITAPFILGVLPENSDITANAFTGRGGNITITTNGIFGLRFQPQLTPNSDITASSQFGISGTVTLNLLDLDPSQGLVALPVEVVDPSSQIQTRCAGETNRSSSFTETGRGGMPASPDDPLQDATIMVNWIFPQDGVERTTQRPSRQPSVIEAATPPAQLIEAQGWVMSRDGSVYLVAQVPNGLSRVNQYVPVGCIK